MRLPRHAQPGLSGVETYPRAQDLHYNPLCRPSPRVRVDRSVHGEGGQSAAA
jgi:hypothetical protein